MSAMASISDRLRVFLPNTPTAPKRHGDRQAGNSRLAAELTDMAEQDVSKPSPEALARHIAAIRQALPADKADAAITVLTRQFECARKAHGLPPPLPTSPGEDVEDAADASPTTAPK